MWVLAALVEIVCALTEPDVIVVDGMLDDWRGVTPFEVGSGRGDADVRFRCNYDPTYLYVSLDVVDDRLIRTAKAGPGEDHVVLAFGAARILLYPAQLEYNAKRKLIASGLGKVEAADSLQPKGWSVELAVPLRRIPGWGKGVPSLPFRFEVQDADGRPVLFIPESEVPEAWLAIHTTTRQETNEEFDDANFLPLAMEEQGRGLEPTPSPLV